MDNWEMEGRGHPPGRGGGEDIPEIGVKRSGRVMGKLRASSPKGQSLTNAGRRPGYAEDRAGLGEFIELGADPCAWLPGSSGRWKTPDWGAGES